MGVKVEAEVISSEKHHLPDELQLQKLLVRLEDWPLGEELAQNAPEPSHKMSRGTGRHTQW